MADSDSNLHPILQQCYTMIKAGNRADAGRLLKAYVGQNAQDADAWWLMAYTVSDIETRIKCVERVVTLKPEYPNAQETLAKLRARAHSVSNSALPGGSPADSTGVTPAAVPSSEATFTPPAPPFRRPSSSPFTVDISEEEAFVPPLAGDGKNLDDPDDSFFLGTVTSASASSDEALETRVSDSGSSRSRFPHFGFSHILRKQVGGDDPPPFEAVADLDDDDDAGDPFADLN